MKKGSKTQIIATLGPSSQSPETISSMINSMVDVARFNFSWNEYPWHKEIMNLVRKIGKEKGKTIPIIQDLSGPRIQKEEGHKFDDKALSVITSKDREDLKFGKDMQVEYVALSFVGSADDIFELRSILKEMNFNPKIISKIERQKALDNIDEIIYESDAIMVARGDLGNEVPIEKIPFIQNDIIGRCNMARKPVIVATEMMSSMIEHDIPSRADVSDVSHAIISGVDAVMLSNETAVGKYPAETVAFMEKIINEAERHMKRGYNHL